ncbi:hypothetical protein ACCUM_3123 [Candidatus Accumulibacter phosphatis]|uniref:Uncharacterized protein n=1 Tax=Candidatus Accumulibacter phosphatis TaxID=327160 RepID=A0A5S4EHJ5_9PROT|nr:hypothetical protein ACCUM_3123 [Candidatus Accumulibacter phosphatis]
MFVQRAALILSGIRSDGHREILGGQTGDSENSRPGTRPSVG